MFDLSRKNVSSSGGVLSFVSLLSLHCAQCTLQGAVRSSEIIEGSGVTVNLIASGVRSQGRGRLVVG